MHVPQGNGALYAFGRVVNCEWKHGVVPIDTASAAPAPAPAPGGDSADGSDGALAGRISIIAWGWIDQTESACSASITSAANAAAAARARARGR